MRFALKGKQGKGMKMPEGVVSSNGEYYMKERMVTDPGLTLDNSGIAPQPSRRAKEDDGGAAEGGRQAADDEVRQDMQETPVLRVILVPNSSSWILCFKDSAKCRLKSLSDGILDLAVAIF